ncbi:MAG: alkaline phosphatase family protein [Phycisphaerae bacterium]|jgi:predicted AlkP superfamily pyrophosphatase or phosphodiesterase
MIGSRHRTSGGVWACSQTRLRSLVGAAAWCALVLMSACGCGVPAAQGKADSFGVDFSLPPQSVQKGAIVFFVDGVDTETFQQMLAAGQLPAIQKYFVDRGLYAPHAIANIPSVTLANETSVVTGLFPGHHNITGVNWFDRNQLIWRDYDTIAQKNELDSDYRAANLYEQFPDALTFSLFFQPHRGTTKFYENWTSAGPPFFFGWYEFVDRISLHRLGAAMDIAREYHQFPAVTFVYLLAPDMRAYQCGVSSPQYREALLHSDRQIGRVLGDLDRAGELDKVVIALVSDHGMSDVTRHFEFKEFLREQIGLAVNDKEWAEDIPFERRLADHRKITVVSYGSGDRYFALCMRKPLLKASQPAGWEPWPVRPSAEDLRKYPARDGGVDLPDRLVRQEAIDSVAYQTDTDCIRVIRKNGLVEFRQDGGRGKPITFRAISGTDVLGWSGKVPAELLAGQPATPRQWLEATAGTAYPDLPAQILAYFRSPRAGDLVAFAAPGWDFNRTHRAGHGGTFPQDMYVPMLLAGPGVPHTQQTIARTVDLMPTLLELLGRPVPPGLDGQSLIPTTIPGGDENNKSRKSDVVTTEQ